MAERPPSSHSPSNGLRSVLKHGSRPSTPVPTPPSATSSPVPSVPLFGRSSSSGNVSSLTTLSPSPNHYAQSPGLSSIALSPGFHTKVSFDTFENPVASMFSYTLRVQSDGYKRGRDTRVFLCASSPDESGSQALEWALENLVEDGDELVVLRGFDSDELVKPHDLLREDARDLLRFTQDKSSEYDSNRKISIIVEFIAGKVTATISRLIALYRPDSIIVGSRTRTKLQSLSMAFGAPGMGSVSKYCLSHSPVPVIVVRPERKLQESKQKRRADPKRGLHFETNDRSTANITRVPMSPATTIG